LPSLNIPLQLQYYLNNYNSSLLTELILSLLGTYGPTQDYLDHCHKVINKLT
ncbi:hypothetical protein P7K49_039924, partial [Saguinus oedipus]